MHFLAALLMAGCTHEQALFGMESGSRQETNIECCDNCGETSIRCRFCSRCKSVRYCSKDCQREDWWERHRAACVPTSRTSIPTPDVRITGLQDSTTERNSITLAAREGSRTINFDIVDTPYKRVMLSNVENRFLEELSQIISNTTIERKYKEAMLKQKAQEVFDYFKGEEGNDRPGASLAAKRQLIDIIEVIKHDRHPQDWGWINWALMGVGDRNWHYLP